MRRLNKFLLLAGLAVSQASAANFSYTGRFVNDNDKQEFFFTLSMPGTIILRTYSYAGGNNAMGATIPGGGFDPTISLFDASGATIGVNRDGGCGLVPADFVTGSCWDSDLTTALPPGTYRVVLTQSDNVPNGTGLSDSFYFDAQPNFTQPPGSAAPGFWDYFPSQRTGAYAVDILGVDSSLAPMIASPATLPPGITNSVYSPVNLSAVAAQGVTFMWSLVPSDGTTGLPAGMSLSAWGVVQGTPAAKGIFTFVAQATDGIQPLRQTVTLAVYDPVTITSTILPGGTKGQGYGPFAVTAAGGSGVYLWSSPNLPSGLAISAAGQISGAPLAGGTFPVIIALTDAAAAQTASAMFSIVIAYPPLLISWSGAVPEIALGGGVSAVFSATGGSPPYSFSATGLPSGVTIDSGTGILSGKPGQAGNYSFMVQATDSASRTSSTSGSISVLGITTALLAAATTTAAYTQNIGAAGGVPPYSFSASGVPAGLTLSSSGLLSGTPLAAAAYMLAVQVRDSAGVTASTGLSLVVTGPSPLTVPGGALSGGTVSSGTAYSDSVRAAGGTPPYKWLVTGGTMPDGLSVSSSGAVTGTPAKIGSFTFTAQATDSVGAVASGTFTITIVAGPLTLTPGTLPAGVAGSDYPLQILPASGGLAPYTFAITAGALPGGLNLASGQVSGLPTAQGTFSFTVTATDSSLPPGTATGTFGLTIKPAQADLILSSTSLPFSLMMGATGLPAADSVTVRSSVIRQLLNYTVAATPAVTWLDVTGGGTTPGSIGVALNPSALNLPVTPAAYQTAIVVTCVAPSPCAGNAQTIAVSLMVLAPPPQLTLTSSLLSFTSSPQNPNPSPQTLGVWNSGGGTLGISTVSTADSWITVTGVPGSLPSGPPVPATVSVNPSGLAAGYHRSSITVTSSGGSSTMPVTLLVAPNTTMTLLPGGAQFQAPAGSSPGNPGGSFTVSVAGNSNVSWSASVLPGAGWLSVGSSSGVSATAAPGTVNFSIDPAAVSSLPARTYYGLIRVTSGDVIDSPQDFEVVLNIQPAATPVKPDPEPAGVSVLVNGPGAIPSLPVTLYASSNTPLPYQASTDAASPWLSVSPATGVASLASPGTSTITFTPGKLAAGIYRGGVSYAFSSAAVRTVNVTLIVRAAAGSDVVSQAAGPLAATSCTPAKLAPTQTGLASNFAQPAAWPTPLQIRLQDDCGSLVTQGQVVVTFSNGDPPLALTAVDSTSGNYSGTWTPRSVAPQVSVLARATAPGFPAATTQITGEVTANAAPLLTPNGTLHVFDPLVGGSLGPGNIVQIYGSNLAAQPVVSSTVPLTTSLGGTSVLIGGILSPLFYVSPGQINAQAPFELTANNKYQIIVSANGALATPDTLQVSAVSPGIAAFPGGQIIAQHLDASLVTETSPAKPGEVVIFYLAGLGDTDNPVITGAGSPVAPLARPQDPPIVTLNGATVPVEFAGLTPGLVGLYQINLQVPTNTPDGDVNLVVTQSGQPSNKTILRVHR